MNIESAIKSDIFSIEDIRVHPDWITEIAEKKKYQAILNQLSKQDIDISSLKIRKCNGDEWFCIYVESKYCFCRTRYLDDSQDYSDISKIQVQFGTIKAETIRFDENYIVKNILMPFPPKA